MSLVESHTGKIVHQISCAKSSESRICCLGWGFSVTDPSATKLLIEQLRDRLNLDDFLDHGVSPLASNSPTDLPSELAFLDVEGLLPKLSVLPPSGKE